MRSAERREHHRHLHTQLSGCKTKKLSTQTRKNCLLKLLQRASGSLKMRLTRTQLLHPQTQKLRKFALVFTLSNSAKFPDCCNNKIFSLNSTNFRRDFPIILSELRKVIPDNCRRSANFSRRKQEQMYMSERFSQLWGARWRKYRRSCCFSDLGGYRVTFRNCTRHRMPQRVACRHLVTVEGVERGQAVRWRPAA